MSYGLIPIASIAPAAISLSLLHFVCLLLGATLAVAPELFGVRLPPMPRFAAGVALANVLFAHAVESCFSLVIVATGLLLSTDAFAGDLAVSYAFDSRTRADVARCAMGASNEEGIAKECQ